MISEVRQVHILRLLTHHINRPYYNSADQYLTSSSSNAAFSKQAVVGCFFFFLIDVRNQDGARGCGDVCVGGDAFSGVDRGLRS